MGAVRRRKRVVHVDIGKLRQFRRKVRVVQFLAFMKAQVFEQYDITAFRRADDLLRFRADAVIGEGDIPPAQCRRKRPGQGCQRHVGNRLTLRASEMRRDDHDRALVGKFRDGRRQARNPRGIGYRAVTHGHVQVGAQKYAFAGYVYVVEGLGHVTCLSGSGYENPPPDKG